MRLFEENSPSGAAILDWWKELREAPAGIKANLRRCNSPTETVFMPVSHVLASKLKSSVSKEHDISYDRICALAGILSHVDVNINTPFAKYLSQGEPQRISDLRFRRILQYSKNISEDPLFYQKIIRILHHIKKNANVLDLFSSLYFWGDYVKKRWAYDYYGMIEPSENANNETNETEGTPNE